MSTFFKPYEGGRPFLFISYSHRQSAQVVDTIRILHDRGYRLWYDEGIPAGSDWPANIARHMQDCAAVVFFLSETALASPNCFSEMRTAARLNKPITVVRLDDSVPDERWAQLLRGRPEIGVTEGASPRAEALLASKTIPRRFRHVWWEKIPWRAVGLLLSILLFLAAAGVFYALVTGLWGPAPPVPPVPPTTPAPTEAPTPVPTVSVGEAEKYWAIDFPDAQQELAVRRTLSLNDDVIQKWNLAEVRALYFCGNMVRTDLDGVVFAPDGTCRVNGAPVIQGDVADLRLLPDMVRLETLALICQPVKDVSPLGSHVLLREVYLSGSAVETLPSLQDLPSLEVIHLEHTAVRDLTPLEALPRLKTVTVSRDMLPLRWDDTAIFAVVLAD